MSDLDEVKQLIPHREPFLFVDRIVEREEGRIVTERKVRKDEPQFQGHYPGSPLMPGVLLCESCFQTGAMLLRSAGAPPAPVAGASTATIEKRSRGYLPHWEKEGGTYFVTFRLADSLPSEARDRIEFERRDIVATAEQMDRPLSNRERERLDHLYTYRMDELLNAGQGACYLKDERCAEVVAETLKKFDGEKYLLHAWCVMPNHVHVVFSPLADHGLSEIMHSWKSYTSKACNRILERKGEFWQRESFDRLIRDEAEFEKRIRYTLENPTAAGLNNWRWVGGVAGEAPATLQAGAPALRDEKKPVLTRILEAKFRGMVVPGDQLRIEVAQEEKMGEAYVMNGKVSVDGKNVLRVKFIVAMVEVAS